MMTDRDRVPVGNDAPSPGRRPTHLRALLVQDSPDARDIDANIRRVRTLLTEWPDADVAIFPELFITGYEIEDLHDLSMTVRSSAVEDIAAACANAHTAFIGGYIEADSQGRIFNSLLVINAEGHLAGNYRKTHLFGGEADLFEAGEQLQCIRVGTVSIGPMICFDIEIAEVARTLATERPDVLIAVAANMNPYYDDHLIACQARALDNRTPLIYVNRVGTEVGFEFVGGSRVVGADGHVLCDLGTQAHAMLVEVPLRQDVAGNVDYLNHLRPELYDRSRR